MKTGKRSYPLDQLSVSEDGVSVSIHTHRSQIVVSVDDGLYQWRKGMSFYEFHTMIIANLDPSWDSAPSMMKGSRKSEHSRSTGVEEGK